VFTPHTKSDDVRDQRSAVSVSVNLAAHLLSVSRRTVYNRIRDGRLQTVRTSEGARHVLVASLYQQGFTPQAFATSASSVSFIYRPSRG
jgi:excisionase family DNA binding protein